MRLILRNIALFAVLVAYFVCHRVSKGPSAGKTWMLALTLFSFLLAVAGWALDVRILWLQLYGLLPQQLALSPDPKVYAALDQNYYMLALARDAIQAVIVRSSTRSMIQLRLNKMMTLSIWCQTASPFGGRTSYTESHAGCAPQHVFFCPSKLVRLTL